MAENAIAEAAIAAEFLKVVRTGLVYRGSKPVMWSPVERTALADAPELSALLDVRRNSLFDVAAAVAPVVLLLLRRFIRVKEEGREE